MSQPVHREHANAPLEMPVQTLDYATRKADMTPATSITAAKKELRSLLKTKLSSIPPLILDEQSKTIFTQLTQLPAYLRAQRISIYLSMPQGEVRTAPIVRDAFARGKAVFVPYLRRADVGLHETQPLAYTPARVMDMVRLRDVQDYEGLERDSWGIPSVGTESAVGRESILGGDHVKEGLDLVLLPGVAFGVDGEGRAVQRLGHGRGFYDYFLQRYREAYGQKEVGDLHLFGLALKEQFFDRQEKIPMGAHDKPLDGVVVGDGRVVDFSRL